ncbi:MAG: class I SAM-dependent methyltransferase [Candidatus Aminicenantes bacterium]|nr:MAG: class I SAM-dependent methyltransferase [Candidatus Aminicenantes bacterium]
MGKFVWTSNDATNHTLSLIDDYMLENANYILDVGCGYGYVSHSLERRGFNVYSIDFKDFRRVCSKNFSLYDGVNIPFKDNVFDLIMVVFVLHHIPNEKKPLILKEIYRVAKDYMFVLEDTPRTWLDKLISRNHGYNYRRMIGSRESFGFYSEEEWKRIFSNTGFEVIECLPLSRFSRCYFQPFCRFKFAMRKIRWDCEGNGFLSTRVLIKGSRENGK